MIEPMGLKLYERESVLMHRIKIWRVLLLTKIKYEPELEKRGVAFFEVNRFSADKYISFKEVAGIEQVGHLHKYFGHWNATQLFLIYILNFHTLIYLFSVMDMWQVLAIRSNFVEKLSELLRFHYLPKPIPNYLLLLNKSIIYQYYYSRISFIPEIGKHNYHTQIFISKLLHLSNLSSSNFTIEKPLFFPYFLSTCNILQYSIMRDNQYFTVILLQAYLFHFSY